MNRQLFKNKNTARNPVADTTNDAGGKAYALSDQEALATLACTGTFNDTFYASAETQLDRFVLLSQNVSSEFIAKLAVYARSHGFMKDSPAVLLAILAGRSKTDPDARRYFPQIFNQVVDNGRMLRNFAECVRSGKFGRKSFGSMPKAMMQEWLSNRSDYHLVKDAIGNNPSLVDVINMVHPPHRPIYAFLKGNTKEHSLQELPWEYRTSGELSTEEWKQIALENMGWHALRMNLNTLNRNDCFKDAEFVEKVAARLRNKELILKSKVFPYQIFAAYMSTGDDLPSEIRNALHDAMEIAVQNVPNINSYRPVVALDVSGSMSSSITGYNRTGVYSKITCRDVAALFAASTARINSSTKILAFDTGVRTDIKIDPRDSILTNTKQLSCNGGGTDCSVVLAYLNSNKIKSDLVIYASDNESWIDTGYGERTGMLTEWNKFKKNNPNAKLVCIDIQPNTTTQVKTRKDILNVAGFNDKVFQVIDQFVNHGSGWVAEIEKTVQLS